MLLIAGEKAHSRYMSEDAYKAANNPNAQLLIVPGATHCDLYDGGKEHNKIPFDEIEVFFKENL